MGKIILSVSSVICAECSLALKRFIGSIKGVNSVIAVGRDILISFDSAEIPESEITNIAKNCIEKLGYVLIGIKAVLNMKEERIK